MPSKPVPMRPKLGRSPKHGSRALVRLIRQGKLDRRTRPAKRIEEMVDLIAEPWGGRDRMLGIDQLRARTAAGMLVASEPWLQRIAERGAEGATDKNVLAVLNGAMRILDSLSEQARRAVVADAPSLAEYLEQHATDAAQDRPGATITPASDSTITSAPDAPSVASGSSGTGTCPSTTTSGSRRDQAGEDER